MSQNRPKPKKIPGIKRNIPGRKARVFNRGNKWYFQFARGDFEDLEFKSQKEAMEYARYIKNASVQVSVMKARRQQQG